MSASPKTDSIQDEASAKILLGVLSAIDQNASVTQRSVARDLNIALGLANAYLKRCAKKGWIKVSQVPRNRYAYYLTPQGFAEKSRLTAAYLSQSFSLYRQAREQYGEVFQNCAARGWRRVALAGLSDLSDIAKLYGKSADVAIIGIVDRAAAPTQDGDIPVVADLEALGPIDAAVLTDLNDPQSVYDSLIEALPVERVLAPRLLSVDRRTVEPSP